MKCLIIRSQFMQFVLGTVGPLEKLFWVDGEYWNRMYFVFVNISLAWFF